MAGVAYVSGPSSEPVSLDEARRHLRVDNTAEDDLISAWITTARIMCEQKTKRSFGVQTWRQSLDAFPIDRFIVLAKQQLVSVTSIKYTDNDGIEQTWSASNYVVNSDHKPGDISLAYNIDWPDTRIQTDAVRIIYTAGDVPATIKSAMKLIIGDLYQNRETKISGRLLVNSDTVDNLLQYETLYYLS
jgi:uncharacterized phiE125 gp8 family phage protein